MRLFLKYPHEEILLIVPEKKHFITLLVEKLKSLLCYHVDVMETTTHKLMNVFSGVGSVSLSAWRGI